MLESSIAFAFLSRTLTPFIRYSSYNRKAARSIFYMKPAEDAQPNEVRLARKGVVSVPTIRPSRPPNFRGAPRGVTRGRGLEVSSHSKPYGRGGIELPRTPGFSAGARPPDLPRAERSHSFHQVPKRPSSGRDLGGPFKRPRVLPPGSEVIQDSKELAGPGPSSKSKQKAAADIVAVMKDLPETCQKGAPQSKKCRRGWVCQQVKVLENERGLEVIGHSFHAQGSCVRFECRPRMSLQWKLPPPSVSSRNAISHGDSTNEILQQSATVDDQSCSDYSAVEDRLDEKHDFLVPPGRDVNTSAEHNLTSPNKVADTSSNSTMHPLPGNLGPMFAARRHERPHRLGLQMDVPPFSLNSKSERRYPRLPKSPSDAVSDTSSAGNGNNTQPKINGPSGRSPKPINAIDEVHHSSSQPSTVRNEPAGLHHRAFSSGTLIIWPSDYHSSTSFSTESTATVSCEAIDGPSIMASTLPLQHERTAGPSVFNTDASGTISHAMNSIENDVTVMAPCSRTARSILLDTSGSEGVSGQNTGEMEQSAEELLRATQSSDYTRGAQPSHTLVGFSRDHRDKPRRLLVSPTLGVLSVTMRGSINRTERLGPRRGHVLRPGSEASRQSVDDACLLHSPNGSFLLLGHARDTHEISLIRTQRDKVTDIGVFDRPTQGEKKGGISAVCSMLQPLMFATGGYDHRVHLWDATKDVSRPSPTLLSIKHTSLVQSLLPIRDTSHKLVSAGADCSVHLWDLSSERVVNTVKTSNSVYHVHEASSPFCTLLEVAHRELQFEIRDHRLVPEKPVLRFGYHTPKVHGRYIKGDMSLSTFACGDKDGSVRLWDLRHTASFNILSCLPGRRLTQVLFDDRNLIACSEDHELAFLQHGIGT